jgi:2-amino-4-hydroxy-6-hydroxymethyldihydropteridine diphosphokinase
MTRCLIALGGNLGDVRATFAAALEELRGDGVRIVEVSSLFSTRPMGRDAGGTFLNGAASIETTLDPLPLLDRLLAIEDRLGRRRDRRWGPRAIDLDLILFGNEILCEPRLRVPHPGCWFRRFVLDPLVEIAPDVLHPEIGESLRSLRSRLLVRPFRVACDDVMRPVLASELAGAFPDVEWMQNEAEAALVLSRCARQDDLRKRRIALPSDKSQVVDFVRAVLMAALAEPEISATSD